MGTAGDELVSINGLNGGDAAWDHVLRRRSPLTGRGGYDTVDGTAGNDTFTLTGNESAIGVGASSSATSNSSPVTAGSTPLLVPQATSYQHQRIERGVAAWDHLFRRRAFDARGGYRHCRWDGGQRYLHPHGNESAIGVGSFVFNDIEFFAGNGGIDTVVCTAGNGLVSINGLNGRRCLDHVLRR